MGQKVNPDGLRGGGIKDWDSRWYAREDKVGDMVVEDYNIRKYLKNKLYAAGVATRTECHVNGHGTTTRPHPLTCHSRRRRDFAAKNRCRGRRRDAC